MRTSSSFGVWLCAIASAVPATAQDIPPARPAGDGSAIVVVGDVERKSAWRWAEGEHVIVYSAGGEGELKRVTRHLERLHALMSRLYRKGGGGEVLKLQVVLIESRDRFRGMALKDLRSQEGPYTEVFAGQLHYDPREDGEILVVVRADQHINLNTRRRFNLECDEYLAEGGTGNCGAVVPQLPVLVRPWEAVLYAGFARHFMLTYLPATYPRWYLDGIGALYSTVAVKRNGALDYARPPEAHHHHFQSYGYPDVAAILTGRYLAAAPDPTWSPYGAWLLAHYFLFGPLKPQRAAQFQAYMAAIRAGKPMAEAAGAFGDMRALQREIGKHSRRDIAFSHADAPAVADAEPLVTQLSQAGGALVEARVELASYLARRSGDADPADWLAQIEAKLAQLPFDAEALTFTAEAECRSDRTARCLATAERVLARIPDHAGALAWKGVALTDQALAGPAAARAAGLAEARATIERAIARNDQAVLPRIALFQSFTRAGERVPDPTLAGMTRVIRAVPAAPGPRLYLGQELLRRGDAGLARRLLDPVAHASHDSPEKQAAVALLSALDRGAAAGN